MLGQHLVGYERPVGIELANRHDALALAEQVGQHPGIAHRHGLVEIGDLEAHRQAPRIPVHAAVLHHPAETEAALDRGLARHHLGGVKEGHHVFLKRPQRKPHRQRHPK